MSIMYPFRVFLSYAHADRVLVEKIAAHLTKIGLQPLWDADITPGKPFTDEIKSLITLAHIFIPVITENSQYRPWIHQEIGFALALNTPVLPIAVGGLPTEMISTLQAISVQPDLSDLTEKLLRVQLETLILPAPPKPYGVVEVAEFPENRAEFLARYANWVLDDLGKSGMVRIYAKLSIFSVPDQNVDHPLWDEREGNAPRSEYFRQLQRRERQAFERHARAAGCRLIIDPATKVFNMPGGKARETRLQLVLDFLKSMPSDKIEAAFSPSAQDNNLTIIGDYFFAESMAPRAGVGYLQTIFHAHPPKVLKKVKSFDQLFDELKLQQDTSRENAVRRFEAELAELRNTGDR